MKENITYGEVMHQIQRHRNYIRADVTINKRDELIGLLDLLKERLNAELCDSSDIFDLTYCDMAKRLDEYGPLLVSRSLLQKN